MPKVTAYVNEKYIAKWKAVKNKSELIYKALDAITEGTDMPNGTILVIKRTSNTAQKGRQ